MRIDITGADGTSVTVKISGGYNPDLLEDATSRACRAFKEALAAQTEFADAEPVEEDQ